MPFAAKLLLCVFVLAGGLAAFAPQWTREAYTLAQPSAEAGKPDRTGQALAQMFQMLCRSKAQEDYAGFDFDPPTGFFTIYCTGSREITNAWRLLPPGKTAGGPRLVAQP